MMTAAGIADSPGSQQGEETDRGRWPPPRSAEDDRERLTCVPGGTGGDRCRCLRGDPSLAGNPAGNTSVGGVEARRVLLRRSSGASEPAYACTARRPPRRCDRSAHDDPRRILRHGKEGHPTTVKAVGGLQLDSKHSGNRTAPTTANGGGGRPTTQTCLHRISPISPDCQAH